MIIVGMCQDQFALMSPEAYIIYLLKGVLIPDFQGEEMKLGSLG